MSLRLFAIGLSHRTAPVELRERVDFAREGLEAALAGLAARNAVREMAVLSTCNRAEVYAAADRDDAVDHVARFSASTTAWRRRICSRTFTSIAAPMRRGTSFGWLPASIPSSSASRRSSAR